MAAPEWWNRRVKAKYKELSTALRPSVLVDDLLSEDVISLEDYHQLRADRTEMDRARKLLTEILPYGGEDRLDKLCNILENSDQQQHLVDLIGKRTRPTVVEPRSVPISNEIMQGRLESPQGNLTMSGQLVLDHSGHGQCATSTAVNVAIGALISDPCKHGAADHQGQTHSTRTVPHSTQPSPKEQEYKSLCIAVLKHGSSRWMAIGRALGYSTDQIMTITGSVTSHSDKLNLLLDNTAVAHGHELAMVEVLQACQEITSPIVGIVREELGQC